MQYIGRELEPFTGLIYFKLSLKMHFWDANVIDFVIFKKKVVISLKVEIYGDVGPIFLVAQQNGQLKSLI